MECEKSRPASDSTQAMESLELFLSGNPTVSLSDVRKLFSASAQSGLREGHSPWITLAQDAATCIVMGIDPVTGEGIENADAVIARYADYPYFTESDLRIHIEAIRSNDVMEHALQEEDANTTVSI